jgi:hypothetical protein
MVGYGTLAFSPLVSVKINGFGKFLEQLKLYILTFFGCLKSCGDIYHASHTCTLRKNCRTHVGVRMSYGMGNSIKSLVASDEKVFKNLTFVPIRK